MKMEKAEREMEKKIEANETEQSEHAMEEALASHSSAPHEQTKTEQAAALQQKQELTTRRTQKHGGRKTLPFQIGSIIAGLAVGLLIGFLIGKPGGGEIAVNKNVYDGFTKAAAQNDKAAGIHFNAVTDKEVEQLDEDERIGFYSSYVRNGSYDKALQIYPDGAEKLIAQLNKKGNLNMVKNIKSTLPPITFEKAVIRHDYKKVIELKKKVVDTERRQRDYVEALIMTGDTKAAVKYVKKQKLTNIQFDMERQFNRYVEEKDISYEKMIAGLEKIRGLSE